MADDLDALDGWADRMLDELERAAGPADPDGQLLLFDPAEGD